MNGLIAAAFSRPRTIVLGLIVILFAGALSYRDIPKESSPDITIPTIYVSMTHQGISPEDAVKGGLNPQMFNSFLDGTKSAIEMAATSNATGLLPPDDGLLFPPSSTDDLASVLRPADEGGVLAR